MSLDSSTDAFADTYPLGTVRALLDTDLVAPATYAALAARLETPAGEAGPRFFSDHDFSTLTVALARLFADSKRPAA